MTDLVNTCLEDSMATLVLAKMLLEKHETFIKTCGSYHKLVEIVVGFAMSLGLKKIDNQSPSHDQLSEHHKLVELVVGFTTSPGLKKTDN